MRKRKPPCNTEAKEGERGGRERDRERGGKEGDREGEVEREREGR